MAQPQHWWQGSHVTQSRAVKPTEPGDQWTWGEAQRAQAVPQLSKPSDSRRPGAPGRTEGVHAEHEVYTPKGRRPQELRKELSDGRNQEPWVRGSSMRMKPGQAGARRAKGRPLHHKNGLLS